MKTRVAGVLAACAATVSMVSAPAFAAQSHASDGPISILSGDALFFPITVPIDVCGNAIGILGFAAAGCRGDVLSPQAFPMSQGWGASSSSSGTP